MNDFEKRNIEQLLKKKIEIIKGDLFNIGIVKYNSPPLQMRVDKKIIERKKGTLIFIPEGRK